MGMQPVGFPAVLSAVGALSLLPAAASAQSTARDRWQRVPEVIEALAVGPGSSVADIGAGRGFFTERLASVVGSAGSVFAVDIDPRALTSLRRLAGRVGQGSVVVIEGRTDDPLLPADSLDAALIVNAYHEMTAHEAMLAAIHASLKSGGRLVILDPFDSTRGFRDRRAQQRAHMLESGLARADLERAGFEVLRVEEGFAGMPGSRRLYWMIVARRQPLTGTP